MTRQAILDNIRYRLAAADKMDRRPEGVLRLQTHPRNTLPSRAQGSRDDLVALFETMLERMQGQTRHVETLAEVPRAIADYLEAEAVGVHISAEVGKLDIPWEGERRLTVKAWEPRTSVDVSVTASFGAAAETGTVVVGSSPDSPLTQSFLGDTHIVLLRREDIVGSYEEIFDKVRAAGMPRHFTFVSGPSCTGDIEMILEYGAHGPRKLCVLIIGDGDDN